MSEPKRIGELMTVPEMARALGVRQQDILHWLRHGTPRGQLVELRIEGSQKPRVSSKVRATIKADLWRDLMGTLDFYAEDTTYMLRTRKQAGEDEHVWKRPIMHDGGRRARVLLGEEEPWDEGEEEEE